MAVAKTKKKEDEVKIISGELETKLQSNLKVKKNEVKADLGEVSLVATEQPTAPPTKMVKILMKENHKCCIGGEWYYLLQGKQYNVPSNVKDVLLKANKLLPL